MHAFGGEKFARGVGVFGGYAQACALLYLACIVKASRHGYAHAALGNSQVKRLVQARCAPFGTVLYERVLACYAQIGTAILHIGGHVGGAHQHHAQVGLVGGQNQLARCFGVFQHLNACGFEQGQGFVKNAAFR